MRDSVSSRNLVGGAEMEIERAPFFVTVGGTVGREGVEGGCPKGCM
jgi:hypothetical protein